MDVVFEQYFDFGIMRDEFGFVLDGFWETLQLSLVSGVLALIWGLVLALAAAAAGSAVRARAGARPSPTSTCSEAFHYCWWC